MSLVKTFLLLHIARSIWCDINPGYIGAVSALTFMSVEYLNPVCYKYECCTAGTGRVHWVKNDIDRLTNILEDKLYGQHIAFKILAQQLAAFLIDASPTKPFVVHISGKTGTGKNHIANLIAQARYVKGTYSKFILKIIATHEFATMDTETAKRVLKERVTAHVSKCPHSLVIIDESEKLPDGAINAISPFLDINNAVDGVDYRRTVFVFLSNTAGNAIKDYTDLQLQSGRAREDITVHEMESLIQEHLYNSGELLHSSLISRYQLDAFIPMLPLEKRHVKQCAEEQLRARRNKCGCSDDEKCISTRADEVVNEIDYTGRFSRSGCKKIATKANLICPLDTRIEL